MMRRSILAGALALGPACASAPAPAPASAPAPVPAPAPAHETFTLVSEGLGETRRINLSFPPSYAASPAARFPVLYMPDGGMDEDFPHVAATVDAAIRAGEMRPVVVVGIENTERRRDMTPPTVVDAEKKIAPHVGGAAAFRAFVRDELIPAIDARVRTDGRRAIIGESLAGLFILDTLLVEPALFDTYVALSPTSYWNEEMLLRAVPEWRKAHPELARTVYLSVAGDDDVDAATSTFARLVGDDPPRGLAFVFEPRPTEKHATIYRAAEGPALRRVLPPESPPRAP